jgi:aminoglycoside phosphotransferase family enzyme/predicted kinase
MNEHLPPLIAAMLRSEFYPDTPAEVELRQTHISYVLLAGKQVYKNKKSIKFPFLDYSTLEKRKHFCAEEIRLNRRLAPDTYLGVVGIGRAGKEFFFQSDSSANAAEYAVKMKRLPDERMLSSLLARGAFDTNCFSAIAKKLAAFHLQAPVEKAALYGAPAMIRANLEDNFRDVESFVGRTVSRVSFEAMKTYSAAFQEQQAGLLAGRAGAGRVCEGHGDLRAEHICLVDGIEIFDCVEFDPALRYGDIASEIAFLSMDLDFLGFPELANRLENDYAAVARDTALATLLPFYKSYRACVRGKVESLKSEEREIAPEDRRRASLQALRYFCLGTRYTRAERPPMLIAVGGLIGTGKSTLAGLIGALTGLAVFSSDRERKQLAGTAPTERKGDRFQQGIYRAEFTEKTYARLLDRADRCLAGGRGVVIDASFAAARQRRPFLELANRRGVPALFIECESTERIVQARLAARQSDPAAVSDADWETYKQMRRRFEPFTELPEESRLVLTTDPGAAIALDKVQARL